MLTHHHPHMAALPASRETGAPAKERVQALNNALAAMAITDPVFADTETLAHALRHLNKAHRWVSNEIRDRMIAETELERAA